MSLSIKCPSHKKEVNYQMAQSYKPKYKKLDINMSIHDYVSTIIYIRNNCGDDFKMALEAFHNESYLVIPAPEATRGKQSKVNEIMLSTLIKSRAN